MVYSNFSKKDLEDKFGVKFKNTNLFSNIQRKKPSKWLISSLKKSEKMGFCNEKARSERVINPILTEIAMLNEQLINKDLFSILSGMNLDVDVSLGLNGECDFLFAFSGSKDFVSPPIFCITEAKKQDLDSGIIQASAQVVGAKIFNERENYPSEILFGATTTGDVWRFLKYQNNEIFWDNKFYYLADLPKLLGVLQNIVKTEAKMVFK